MADHYDRNTMLRQRDAYLKELESDPNPERRRERLCAMANALQMALTISNPGIPQSRALETIMRGIAHSIEGNPDMRGYVREKVTVGLGNLA